MSIAEILRKAADTPWKPVDQMDRDACREFEDLLHLAHGAIDGKAKIRVTWKGQAALRLMGGNEVLKRLDMTTVMAARAVFAEHYRRAT